MNDITFAIPRHEYASYDDLYRLIELSGFPTCFIDEIDPASDRAYIITVLNAEVPAAGYPGARARIALWDLEWHLDGVPALPGVEYWAADRWYAECIGARYVPMGSHRDLCPERTPKQDVYDVAFIGYFDGVPRRQVIRKQLAALGLHLSPPLAWGETRHAVLRNSAAYLHAHQLENAPAIPPLRMVVAAAYALPVITETCADAGIFRRHILQADYGQLAAATVTWTRQRWQEELLPRGMSLHQKLCVDLTFRKSVEKAL
jgi:hypothetical protein